MSRIKRSLGRLGSLAWGPFVECVTRWADEARPFLLAGTRQRVYDAWTTFLLFLRQMMPDRPTTRVVVVEHAADRIAAGKRAVSPNNSAFCQARKRLGMEGIMATFEAVVRGIGRLTAAMPSPRWRERDVFIVDGTCLTLPDSPANRAAYPLQGSIRPGCGFPLMRLLAVFSLATGVMVRYRTGTYREGELSLFNALMDDFKRGDVVLADRYFCSWAHLVRLGERGVDTVVRIKESRKRRRVIRSLGRGDQLVAWAKPDQRPAWIDRADWARMPEELVVREIECVRQSPGARTTRMTVATTLLDAKAYPARAFGELYRDRWEAELNLRDLKSTLGLDFLTSLSPAMVGKELAVCLCGCDCPRADGRGGGAGRVLAAGTAVQGHGDGAQVASVPEDVRAGRGPRRGGPGTTRTVVRPGRADAEVAAARPAEATAGDQTAPEVHVPDEASRRIPARVDSPARLIPDPATESGTGRRRVERREEETSSIGTTQDASGGSAARP